MKSFIMLCCLGTLLMLPGLALAQPDEAPESPRVVVSAPDARSTILSSADAVTIGEIADSFLQESNARLEWLHRILIFLSVLFIIWMALSWQLHANTKSAENIRGKCEQLLKEMKELRCTASEHTDFINEQRGALISQAPMEISSLQQEAAQSVSAQDTTRTALFAEAVTEAKNGNHSTALILWEQYLKRDSSNANALFNAAGSAYRASLQEYMPKRTELLHCAIGFLCRIPAEERNDLVLFNWGRHLSTLGTLEEDTHEKLIWWRNAYRKYEEAAEINPSKPEIWNSLAGVMLHMLPHQVNKDSWLASAEEHCRKAEQIAPGSGAYNLACVYSHQGHSVEECLAWLEKSLAAGKFPPVGYVNNDPDLGSLTSEPAFLEFIKNVEKKSFVNTL